MKRPESNLTIELINASLTHGSDNLLQFMTEDEELSSLVSQLLSDLGRMNKLKIKCSKLKLGQILVTPKGKIKTLTGIIAKNNILKLKPSEILRSKQRNSG